MVIQFLKNLSSNNKDKNPIKNKGICNKKLNKCWVDDVLCKLFSI